MRSPDNDLSYGKVLEEILAAFEFAENHQQGFLHWVEDFKERLYHDYLYWGPDFEVVLDNYVTLIEEMWQMNHQAGDLIENLEPTAREFALGELESLL